VGRTSKSRSAKLQLMQKFSTQILQSISRSLRSTSRVLNGACAERKLLEMDLRIYVLKFSIVF
jgi:hypothetical protein